MSISLIGRASVIFLNRSSFLVKSKNKTLKVMYSAQSSEFYVFLPLSRLFIILVYFQPCQWAGKPLLEVLLPDCLALVLQDFAVTFSSSKV